MKYLIIFLFVTACASRPAQLTERAKDIDVVTHKPNGCSTMGKVVGHDKSGSRDVALNDALNQAASLSSTHLHVNQEVPNGRHVAVHATGYRCD